MRLGLLLRCCPNFATNLIRSVDQASSVPKSCPSGGSDVTRLLRNCLKFLAALVRAYNDGCSVAICSIQAKAVADMKFATSRSNWWHLEEEAAKCSEKATLA